MSAISLMDTFCRPNEQALPDDSKRVKAVAWARVSTDMQEERGLSIPEQLSQMRHFATREGMEIVEEYAEAASAYQKEEKRVEFHRMLASVKADRSIRVILVHDFSRFSRDYDRAGALLRELGRTGIRVISVQEGELETETVLGVWKKAITLAKNEAYSKEVAFHTRKGCKANVQTRDPETGWCYKNGGQPLFGYKSVQLIRGEERRGRPIIKSIWVKDDTLVNGKPIHEWARECLLMAAKGASLASLRDYCNRNGIPGRRSAYWVTNTWHFILQPSSVLKYCGIEVYNVHTKQGQERPASEWVTVENAHPALISEEEAQAILRARQMNSRKRFDRQSRASRQSEYLLSGGLFTCGRCGANMIGHVTSDGTRYRCASHARGKAFKCGPGVMARQPELEGEVIDGLKAWLDECANPHGFAQLVNEEYRALWQQAAGIDPGAERKRGEIDRKIENLRRALEGEVDEEELRWTRRRIQDLKVEREALAAQTCTAGQPPKIDTKLAMSYRTRIDRLLADGSPEERKALLRECVETVVMHPEDLTVEIRYQLPGIPITTMNPGFLAENGVHCHTFGSGGRRLGDREHIFASQHSSYPAFTLKMPA